VSVARALATVDNPTAVCTGLLKCSDDVQREQEPWRNVAFFDVASATPGLGGKARADSALCVLEIAFASLVDFGHSTFRQSEV
jgi:hypothetical protein